MSSGREKLLEVVAGSTVGPGAGAKEEELEEFWEGSEEESRARGESRELREVLRALGRSLAIQG